MFLLAHINYPVLLFIIIAQIFRINFSLLDLIILIFFSILPDFDYIYSTIKKRDNNGKRFNNHTWITHWPITYLPLVILLIIFPSQQLLLACIGIYSHFTLDTFFAGAGIMWFYPFSNKFYNFFCKKTKGHRGPEWLVIYRKTGLLKIDIALFIILLVILIGIIF